MKEKYSGLTSTFYFYFYFYFYHFLKYYLLIIYVLKAHALHIVYCILHKTPHYTILYYIQLIRFYCLLIHEMTMVRSWPLRKRGKKPDTIIYERRCCNVRRKRGRLPWGIGRVFCWSKYKNAQLKTKSNVLFQKLGASVQELSKAINQNVKVGSSLKINLP